MHKIRHIYLLLGLFLYSGCTSVKVALYDNDKRQEYTIEAKKAFANSPEGKELAIKQSIMETADKYVGTRYKYGSIDPKQGFDCSGLVYYVAKKHDIELPRSSGSMAAAAPHIPWKKASPGDLVFFGDHGHINHVAIIEKVNANELWVIHSTINRGVFKENVLVSSYWKTRVLFAVDFSTLVPEKNNPKS